MRKGGRARGRSYLAAAPGPLSLVPFPPQPCIIMAGAMQNAKKNLPKVRLLSHQCAAQSPCVLMILHADPR